jgi:hypothetical protein
MHGIPVRQLLTMHGKKICELPAGCAKWKQWNKPGTDQIHIRREFLPWTSSQSQQNLQGRYDQNCQRCQCNQPKPISRSTTSKTWKKKDRHRNAIPSCSRHGLRRSHTAELMLLLVSSSRENQMPDPQGCSGWPFPALLGATHALHAQKNESGPSYFAQVPGTSVLPDTITRLTARAARNGPGPLARSPAGFCLKNGPCQPQMAADV